MRVTQKGFSTDILIIVLAISAIVIILSGMFLTRLSSNAPVPAGSGKSTVTNKPAAPPATSGAPVATDAPQPAAHDSTCTAANIANDLFTGGDKDFSFKVPAGWRIAASGQTGPPGPPSPCVIKGTGSAVYAIRVYAENSGGWGVGEDANWTTTTFNVAKSGQSLTYTKAITSASNPDGYLIWANFLVNGKQYILQGFSTTSTDDAQAVKDVEAVLTTWTWL